MLLRGFSFFMVGGTPKIIVSRSGIGVVVKFRFYGRCPDTHDYRGFCAILEHIWWAVPRKMLACKAYLGVAANTKMVGGTRFELVTSGM